MIVAEGNFNPGVRGYHAVYREHQTNHCPGCGRTQWLIGRMSAECVFCGTALALGDRLSAESSQPVVWTRGKGGGGVR